MSAGTSMALSRSLGNTYLDGLADRIQETRNTDLLLGLTHHEIKRVMGSVRGLSVPSYILDTARSRPLIVR